MQRALLSSISRRAMSTKVTFTAEKSFKPTAHLLIGDKARLTANSFQEAQVSLPVEVTSILDLVSKGTTDSATVWSTANAEPESWSVAHFDNARKRNLGALRHDLLADLVSKNTPKDKDVEITVLLDKVEQIKPAAFAIARSFPLFTKKSKETKARTVATKFVLPNAEVVSDDLLAQVQIFADGVRETARLVDMPTCFLNTQTYLKVVQEYAAEHDEVTLTTFVDEQCKDEGLGGIYAVGKCAQFGPVFAILEYKPKTPAKGDLKLGLVGKGICYDTGGLSLKVGGSMCSMKSDMGGSAAVFTAFQSLVATQYPHEIAAALCIAENAIGPKAYKNDDIITCYSGRTVEINNTDAEGRMVLADGVAYMSKNFKPTHMLDAATLTGAQLIATGVYHAGILVNDPDFEDLVYDAGQASGDWTFPLLYAPEILAKQFDSQVADCKNSVKDRMNAQSSCAGHFIEAHLHPDWKGKWAHVDLAGPSFRGDRATGFGSALLVETAHRLAATATA